MAPRAVRIDRIGAHAAPLLAGSRSGLVVAAFEKAIYVDLGRGLICIGSSEIGDGPIHALSSAWRPLTDAGHVRVGETVSIDAEHASIWTPPPWPRPVRAADLQRAAARLHAFLASEAPAEGLARMVLDAGFEPRPSSAALARVAKPRIAQVRAWLAAAAAGEGNSGTAPVGLLGLGPGLTPSGDDLIGGICIASAAAGRMDVLRTLSETIKVAAPTSTSVISAAFLRSAVDGVGSARLHAALCCLLDDSQTAMTGQRLRDASSTGATSGFDALAGCWLALDALSRRRALGY